MSADAAAAKLIEMIHSKKVDDRTKLMAVKDLLDRANLSGTQSVELTVEKGKTFDDVLEGVLVDVDEDDDGRPSYMRPHDPDIVDAEVIDEAEPHSAFDPETMSRHDRAALGEALRNRDPRPPRGLSQAERKRREAAALAEAGGGSSASMTDPTIARAAYLAALESGATKEEAEAAGRATTQADSGKRRARTTKATITTGSGQRQRRE